MTLWFAKLSFTVHGMVFKFVLMKLMSTIFLLKSDKITSIKVKNKTKHFIGITIFNIMFIVKTEAF